MTKSLLSLILLPLLLAGCAQMPDTQVTRHQIDDLRDHDKDGVINQRDMCADTPTGTKVDITGCAPWEVKPKYDIQTVYFNYDDAHIRLDQNETYTLLFNLLEQKPQAKVILVGDTSPEGTDQYNKALAQRRTGVIKDALIENGIAPERISEQEFTQVTELTKHLKKRERRTIAVITSNQMELVKKWTIYSSEQSAQHASTAQ